jgi:hypothetical protein
MFPNIEWDAENKHFKRQISTNPPSREDVNSLQKMLDEKLVVRQARYFILNSETRVFARSVKNCIVNVSTK